MEEKGCEGKGKGNVKSLEEVEGRREGKWAGKDQREKEWGGQKEENIIGGEEEEK